MTDLPRDLADLRADLAAARLPRSRARVAALSLAAAVTITAAALAADHYLGQPAPAHVRATFAKYVNDPRWTVKPVLEETVQVLAFSAHGTMYGARATDGQDCVEFVTSSGTNYLVGCANFASAHDLILLPSFPFHGDADHVPPYVLAGRLSSDSASLAARLPDGRSERIPLGLRGYFVFEPRYQAAARRGEVTLVERDRAGTIRDRVRVPPQIVARGIGVPIRRVVGWTAAPTARYASFMVLRSGAYGPVGSSGYAPIGKDGSFSWTVPKGAPGNRVVDVRLVNARFMAVEPEQDAWPIPDDRAWQKARAEARP